MHMYIYMCVYEYACDIYIYINISNHKCTNIHTRVHRYSLHIFMCTIK